MSLVAILENATEKGYTKKLNDIWEATFSMPANDPKVKLCTPFRIVELFDGEDRVDLFRILPSDHSSDESEEKIVFNCEHVLATLTDDLLFQYHECNDVPTTNVLSYILDFQTTSKWQLGQVDFALSFRYKWESENLLSAIFSVPATFVDEYQWTWDTTTIPWTLNLISPNHDIKTWIRYGRNLKGVSKHSDPSKVCTRLYGLGYGEGINQLTISEVNGGVPFIEANTLSTYGVISRIFTDTTVESSETLKAKMESVLSQLKIPRIEYSVDAAHLYQITKKSIDNFYIGAYCRTIDKEDDLRFTARVVSINKPDIDGDPGNINLEIANSQQDITTSINSIANRQTVSEVYSQGATNLLVQDFADNADSIYAAVMRFYIPEETVRINKIELNFKTTNFRAYSRATKGGGASQVTSMNSEFDYDLVTLGTKWQGYTDPGYEDSGYVGLAGGEYNVAIHPHYHELNAGGLQHIHKVNLPDHTHDIEYGIYLKSDLPSAVTVTVDGNEIPGLDLNEDRINIIPYLETSNGKIIRGAWHEIQITPNDLARIEANIVTQLFVQSRGGGNY